MAKCRMKKCRARALPMPGSVFQLCQAHIDELSQYVNYSSKGFKQQSARYMAARRLFGWA
jgi:hypothetical protein